MPVIFKKNFNHFLQFAAELVSNFDIGYTKYQNIVRNQLGKELEQVFGINIMVPKDDMGEKPKEQKEALQESLSLTFTEHNGVVAAYTNVRNTVEWLLSKKTLHIARNLGQDGRQACACMEKGKKACMEKGKKLQI